jgi:hypothetical protein
MRRRTFLVALTAAGALLIPAGALAKGPTLATITGPGLDTPLQLSGYGENGEGPLGALTMEGAFFPQAFGQSPDPTFKAQPKRDLGPRYLVTYTVPGPTAGDKLLQDLYPYAVGGVVTYMKAGQVFWGDQRTHGGWYRAQPGLKAALVAAGLPKTAPVLASPSNAAVGRRAIALGAGAGLLLAGGVLLLVRRRH